MNRLLLGERFVLEREIGAGGMARVFLGTDEVLERPVAVKVLKAGYDETDIGARFRREGRTAARLSHPNIVQVYDAGEGELEGREVSYIVMEYVSGGDLKALIDEKGFLGNEELAVLGAGAAAGLAHAHERGVVHRDVKPHNVMIDDRGRPKLTDFGIARALDASQATRTGSYLGTALYSAPEQLRGERVTPKSDVYSLGVTLYQAAVGEAPFVGSPLTVAHQHVSMTPTPPRERNDSVSEALDALILDCVRKDPDERPTAEEVHERLRREARPTREKRAPAALTATTPKKNGRAAEPPPTARPEGPGRRSRAPILLAATALLLVLLGVAAFAMAGRDPASVETARNPAEGNRQLAAPESDPEQADAPENDVGQGEDRGTPPPLENDDAAPAEEQPGQEQPAPQEPAPEQPAPRVGGGGGQDDANPGEANLDGTSGEATPEEAAAQTIVDHYAVASGPDYQNAWNYLSSRYQQEIEQDFGSSQGWTDQFSTLNRVEYTQGPTAEVNGDTATVSFSTIAYHDYGPERRAATATLVRESGEWRIDDLNAA